MGFRFRKSIKIAPGVKLNFGKKSIGISAGTKGARVSVNSKGKVTETIKIPGTGISYVKTHNLHTQADSSQNAKTDFAEPSPDTRKHSQETACPNVPLIVPARNVSILKGIVRYSAYVMIPLILIGVNANLFFPAILLDSIVQLIYLRKSNTTSGLKKLSTVVSVLFAVLAAFGSVVAYTPPVESITLAAENTTMDINETQPLDITISPENASHIVSFAIENEDIAKIEKDENGVYILYPLAEGETEITVSANKKQSDTIEITVVDQERIEEEKRLEEERIAAEKKAEEERIAAEEKAAQERANAQATQQNSRTVYITPTGEKYHYSGSCNGGSYFATTLDDALRMGLTPCKKCVG